MSRSKGRWFPDADASIPRWKIISRLRSDQRQCRNVGPQGLRCQRPMGHYESHTRVVEIPVLRSWGSGDFSL